MPWISDDFTRYFSWQGRGEMPAEERELLKRIVEAAHRLGFRLRFWATPDYPVVWRELQNAGVDLIGADDLYALQGFLKK
ncbi:MAG: hypothetical protein JSU96_01060 [Acidobacteriota bacterium]|nr:MAG: hypothetical protein JSU96_01060 [Acidobacteriota bacterium]